MTLEGSAHHVREASIVQGITTLVFIWSVLGQ